MHLTATIIASLLTLLGLVCSVLPSLPGPPLALIGIILYGWFTHFQTVSVFWVVVFSVLTLLTILFEVFAPALISKGYKASKYGAWGAALGGIAGLITLGPLGAFLGPFIGAFLAEYYTHFDANQAARTAWGALVGVLIGSLFKFAVSLAMAGYFLAAVIRFY